MRVTCTSPCNERTAILQMLHHIHDVIRVNVYLKISAFVEKGRSVVDAYELVYPLYLHLVY